MDYIVTYSYSKSKRCWVIEVVDELNKVVDSEEAIREEQALQIAKKLVKKYKALRVCKIGG